METQQPADLVAPVLLAEILHALEAMVRTTGDPLDALLIVGVQGRVGDDVVASIKLPALHVRQQIGVPALHVREMGQRLRVWVDLACLLENVVVVVVPLDEIAIALFELAAGASFRGEELTVLRSHGVVEVTS